MKSMLTQKALRESLSPKQTVFIENLDREGATYTLLSTKGYPHIVVTHRQPRQCNYNGRGHGYTQKHDYDESDYEITDYDLAVNGWN